jgi:hypothetical protein
MSTSLGAPPAILRSRERFTPAPSSCRLEPSAQSFSFLGVSFNAGEQIGKVRITSGNSPLGAAISEGPGSNADLVVMDDFIYAEPKTVPDYGSTALLLGLSFAAVVATRRNLVAAQT